MRWPTISRGDHLPGAGRLALASSPSARSAGVALSTTASNSATYECISAGPSAVGQRAFRNRQCGNEAVRVPDVEEHPFRDFACHLLRPEVHDEQGLSPDEIGRIRT